MASNSRDAEKVASLKDNLTALALKRVSAQSQAEATGLLAELKTEKQQLESTFNASKTDILSPAQGIYSTNIDGYEQLLSTTKAQSMTVADYQIARKSKPTEDDIKASGVVCKIIDNYNSMIKEIASISTQDNSKAIIRATTAMLPYNIISIVASFKKECEWADIHVEEFESEDILKMLKDNECDLAFFRVGKFDEDAYEKLPILTEKFVAILPANHPLAKESSISLAQLINENFIFCRQNTGLHRNSVSACHTMGFNPNIIATSNHASNIFEMVAMNMGVSLLLKRGAEYAMTDHFADKVSIVPLKETFTIEVALARYKKHNHTKASIAFWDYVKHMVEASQ